MFKRDIYGGFPHRDHRDRFLRIGAFVGERGNAMQEHECVYVNLILLHGLLDVTLRFDVKVILSFVTRLFGVYG
jgi:hypothetical protein